MPLCSRRPGTCRTAGQVRPRMKIVLFQVRSALSWVLHRIARGKARAGKPDLVASISQTVAATEADHRRILVSERRWAELGATVALDAERLRQIEAETERVSTLLGKVFARAGTPDDDCVGGSERFPGLEPRHAGFLAELAERETIETAAYVALVRQHGLLPAGAMETINDWAFDRLGETVIEDGDPIEIARDLLSAPEVGHEMRR